jgi:hypothetical protein
MKLALTRTAVFTAAAVLGTATLGCGIVSQVKQAADNLTAVTDAAQKLGDMSKLTFTADYKLQDGSTATVVQQPPNAAFVGRDGRFIFTADAMYLCSKKDNAPSCQKTRNTSGSDLDATAAGYIPGAVGAGFISAPIAVGMMTVAAVTPGAKVDKSDRKIGGLSSTCLKVTGIRPDDDPNTADVKEFTVCIADNGLLTQFSGVDSRNEKVDVELTKYAETADPKQFQPPAGYKIIDVEALQK